MDNILPPNLNGTNSQQCELSQKPRSSISLSLKRKHNVDKGTKPTLKRWLLSLKRNNDVRKDEIIKDPNGSEINGQCPNLGLVNNVNNSINTPCVNITEVENADSGLNKSITDANINTVCHTPALTHDVNIPNQPCLIEQNDDCVILDDKLSLITVSSATEIESLETIVYDKPSFSTSFALADCQDVNVNAVNSSIKGMLVSCQQNNTRVDCELMESSQELHSDNLTLSLPEEQAVYVNLEIKNRNLSTSEDKSKVLILNTNAIEKLSHVIVQPPSYKPFRRKIQGQSKILSSRKSKSVFRSASKNGKVSENSVKLNQIRIDTLFKHTSYKTAKHLNGIGPVSNKSKPLKLRDNVGNCENEALAHDDMSKAARADTVRSDGVGRLSRRVSREEHVLYRSSKKPYKDPMSQIRASNSEAPQLPSPRCKNESASSCSPRRNIDSLHLNLPVKTKSNKNAVVPRDIPHYKIVAGTHFAVDAFCYGDIPGVKNYFLTHFHSDHYSGLKKTFNKSLFCTQITADLCTSRLGVISKYIHVISLDETLRVDGVEVTAIDANHCPGAVMLLFTLPNGKTLLHTGDFRATPAMESHPAFWNSDIHTIYLDTTYCNPRYDFPTQDQSLEMALYILRQKKMALEKVGKKFASVLIVCGTYTIGKEKFFLGLAKRVGCSVWACPEKDKVLQTVEKKSFSHASPQSCQLHVVPMRDLTHEKLRSYLDSLQGPFSEVVAFKPSGWENGKNTPTTKDMVTVHGIPYSEHSSFSEMIRFVNFLKPKQVVPTVDISGGVKAVQKYFPCPLVYKEDLQCQSKITDFFNVQSRQQISAVS